MNKVIHMIVDLQFGSCGKGLLAGYLAQQHQPDTVVAAWAPNAGHTFIDSNGRKMINIALPNGIVSPNLKRVMIGPGSVINPELLMSEIEEYADLLGGVQIMIHENAAIVTEEHRAEEAAGMVGIGSTMKGVGAATIQKIRRQVNAPNIAYMALQHTPLEGYLVDAQTYAAAIDESKVMLVEGAQGFSLGINSGMYPYVTSRECTIAQLVSDCAIPVSYVENAIKWGTCRTYPIRVANRFKDGHQIGFSGPGYYDQQEIDWKDIGREPELTTVTRLPRRIFTFSMQQIIDAVRMNGIDEIFLNFCNYMSESEVQELKEKIYNATGLYPSLAGYGPTTLDVVDVDRPVVQVRAATWPFPTPGRRK